MLKHIVATHENEDMNTIKFKMKIVSHTRTSFERQIKESVLIQHERKNHHLLNSRSEYNRCSLPRLCTQVGDGEYKKYNKEPELEKQEEEKLENKIRELRKVKNKARHHPTREGDLIQMSTLTLPKSGENLKKQQQKKTKKTQQNKKIQTEITRSKSSSSQGVPKPWEPLNK